MKGRDLIVVVRHAAHCLFPLDDGGIPPIVAAAAV